MSGNQVRLTNGELWTWQQFLEHYFEPTGSGSPTPVEESQPVIIDRNWYMSEGPGRYYHPGMFPIIRSVSNRNDIKPGTYAKARHLIRCQVSSRRTRARLLSVHRFTNKCNA